MAPLSDPLSLLGPADIFQAGNITHIQRDASWFIAVDGTCGPFAHIRDNGASFAILFLSTVGLLAYDASINIKRGMKRQDQRKLFTWHMPIEILSSTCSRWGGFLIAFVLSGNTGFTDTDRRAAFWAIYMSPQCGTFIAVGQLLRKEWSMIALAQMLAECILTWVGCAYLWLGEMGQTPRIKNRTLRIPLLISSYVIGVALLLNLFLSTLYIAKKSKHSYSVFSKAPACRAIMATSGMAIFTGCMIVMVFAIRLCGSTVSITEISGIGLHVLVSTVLMCFGQ